MQSYRLRAYFGAWLGPPLVIAAGEALSAGTPDYARFTAVWAALLVLWALLAMVLALWAIEDARRKAWRYALASLALPVLLLVDPNGAAYNPLFAGDIVHFAAIKPSYDRILSTLPSDEPKFMRFRWGAMLDVSDEIIYDETDQIALPPERRSSLWREQHDDGSIARCLSSVQRVWVHYYLVRFGC